MVRTRPEGQLCGFGICGCPVTSVCANTGLSVIGIWSFGGPLHWTINATALGKTQIQGEVKYWDKEDRERVEEFFDKTSIETGDSVQSIYVRFMGKPLGSEVRVVVSEQRLFANYIKSMNCSAMEPPIVRFDSPSSSRR
jgi:hypothetical protein